MTPEQYEAIIHRGVPLAGEWGVRVLSAEAGVARIELPYAERLLRPGNTVSGPAIMGLADVAMWAALLSLGDGPEDALTQSMNVAFLRPCGPGPIVAEARVIKGTGRSVFGEVVVTRADAPAKPCVHVTTGWIRTRPAAS